METMEYATLAKAPADTIVTEDELATLLGWDCARSVRRAVMRGELPSGVPLGRRHVWVVGVVRAYIEERAQRLAKRLVNL